MGPAVQIFFDVAHRVAIDKGENPFVNIHEYQAREILNKYGVPTPVAEVASTPDEATEIASRIGGTPESSAFNGHGKCFIEVGGGRAGIGRGNFYGEPNPTIKLHKPGMQWHIAKVLFEKNWMRKCF